MKVVYFMKHISFDSDGGQWLVHEESLRDWTAAHGEDNEIRLARLRRNLALARAQVLTPRQQEVLSLYYDQHMTMRTIAQQLQVTPSTISRTLHRAENRLRSYLRYSL